MYPLRRASPQFPPSPPPGASVAAEGTHHCAGPCPGAHSALALFLYRAEAQRPFTHVAGGR
eukprot:4275690-Pleurochrysis_carterae.AAC.1